MHRAELHWARVLRCYRDRPANLWQQFATVIEERANELAVVENGLHLTYAELDRESGSLAALLSREGVGAGDRVAVMLANGADAVRAVLAVLRLGAVLLAIGTRSRSAELEHFFADAEPSAIIYGPEFADEVNRAKGIPRCQFDVSGEAWHRALAADDAPPAVPDIDEEALFAILYTSGTTGKPKGAMLTHLGAIHSCLHWRETFDLSEDDTTLFCVPWAHVSGLCGVLMPLLYVGGTIVMLPEFNRRRALELAQEHAITHALMVPAMYSLLLLEPDLGEFDLSRWRVAAYGGAPMPEPTIKRFAKVFPNLSMCNAYGATETTSPATIMPPGEGIARSDSIGRVVACGDVVVMDENGREAPCGADGELWIAGPMVIPGYWRNPEATEASFAGGYWKSGDIGSVDADGYVRIADRKKDMIIRGGFKVYPAEVESVIAGFAGVAEAAVVGRPDPLLDEEVVAFISAADERVTEDAIRNWCAARLSDYKVPSRVVLSAEPLPRNVNGKIQKVVLREQAQSLPDRARA